MNAIHSFISRSCSHSHFTPVMKPFIRLRPPAVSKYICNSCTRQILCQRRLHTNPTAASPEIYDIVCVGGGPAGLSLLAALRSSPVTSRLKVALLESQSLAPTRAFSLPPTRFSNRCSSLTPSSVRFLDEIGAWKHVNKERVQAYEEMQVWDGISGARIEFDWPAERGEEGKTIAVMNENLNLTSALVKRLDELGGVEILDEQRVESIALGTENEEGDLRSWPVIKTDSGKLMAARLLVGADGQNSPVRTFGGIETRGWDYDRMGVVATLELGEEGWPKTAYQRFLPTGPVALLPLPGSYATLVWTTTPALAAHLKSLTPTDFLGMVNAAFRLSSVDLAYMHTISAGQEEEFGWREKHSHFDVSKIPTKVVGVQEGSIASFPLKMRHADTYIGERVALVGDAAHTIHPLAGQGLNQGQGDVESLAGTIKYAVEHGMDIGDLLSLERYNSDRYAKNHVLLGVVDKLHKLYAAEGGPIVGLRSLGLRAVNGLGPLKQFFMEQAAGTGVKIL